MASVGHDRTDSNFLITSVPEQDDFDRKSFNSQNSQLAPLNHKPKIVEFMQKSSQRQETVRDFMLNSRQILLNQISIQSKA